MASQTGKRNGTRNKRPRLKKHFYLNGTLHKNLHINRGTDIITTWRYDVGKIVKYAYTDVLAKHRPAFTTKQAGLLLNRKRLALEKAILAGQFERPQFSYTIDENRRMIQYQWSEEDIIAAHQYFSSVHFGRPRKDGLVAPKAIPTLRELRAMMDDEEILYVRQGDTFVPTWKAK